MRKSIKYFLPGAGFGLLMFVVMLFMSGISVESFPGKLLTIVYFPAGIVNVVDSVLHWIADVFNSDIDRGLGFDGGPLEWVEWLSIVVSMIVSYGFISLIIAKLVEFFRKRLDS